MRTAQGNGDPAVSSAGASLMRTAPVWTAWVIVTVGAELLVDAERLRAAFALSLSCGAAAAVVIGLRRHRPPAPAAWVSIATAMVGFAVGNLVWLVTGVPTGGSRLALAVLNTAKLVAVGALLLAAVLAVTAAVSVSGPRRRLARAPTRRPGGGLRQLLATARWAVGGSSASLVDLGMIACGAAFVVAQWTLSGSARTDVLGSPGLGEAALALAAAGIVAVAAVGLPAVARSAAAPQALVAALLLGVVGNLALAVQGPDAPAIVGITPLLVATGLVGLAALHPSMAQLGGRPQGTRAVRSLDHDAWDDLENLERTDLSGSGRVRTTLLIVVAVLLLLDPLLSFLLLGPAAPDLLRSVVLAVLAVAVIMRISSVSASRDELAARLVDSTRRFSALVQHHAEAIVVVGDDRHVRYASPATSQVLGRDPDPLVGMPLAQAAPAPPSSDDAGLAALVDGRWERRTRTPCQLATCVARPDGSVTDVEATMVDLRDVDAVAGVVLHLRDVSDRVQLERRLRDQALTDALTGLPNRVLLSDRLEHALRRTRRSGRRVGVLVVDIDDFKTVNDSLGHSAGDELLVELASRLQACVRPGDTCARLGGDELAVLLEGLTDEREALEVGRRIVRTVRATCQVGGRPVGVTASVGAALSDDAAAGVTGQSLLRDADLAMYQAKRAGGDRVRLFRPEMRISADARLDVHTSLAVAIAHGDLEVHYQPVVSLATGCAVGYEALARWRRDGRLRLASEFVPVAEERDELIAALGETVLEQACGHLAGWLEHHDEALDLHVNVSARQLRRPVFVSLVAEALQRHALPPERVVLELTETALLDTAVVGRVLTHLRGLGVRLAIDDFGSGYSNLQRLRQSSVDVLKLDRSLISEVAEGGAQGDAAASLAGAVTRLADALGATTVAEGVETEAQREVLLSLGCGHGQGWLFGRAVPAAEVEQQLLALEASGVSGRRR